MSATVTLPNGVQITPEMSARDRHNAVAKSMGAPEVARPAPPVFGPPGHTAATLQRLAQGDRAAEAAATAAALGVPQRPTVGAPSTQAAPETAGASPERMGTRTEVNVDLKALQELHDVYRALSPEKREQARATYENDLATIYEGRRAGESLRDFRARQTAEGAGMHAGRVPPAETSVQDHVPGREPSAPSQYTPSEWESGHASVTDANGYVPLERINAEALSGYTLPKIVEGQTYHKGVFAELAAARAAGITQEQINGFIEAQMRRDGFIR